MKRYEVEEDDLMDSDDISDDVENDEDDAEPVIRAISSQKAIWREIEKRRELLALSRMIGESIDDQIFNE